MSYRGGQSRGRPWWRGRGGRGHYSRRDQNHGRGGGSSGTRRGGYRGGYSGSSASQAQTRPRLSQTILENVIPSPYKGWHLYFPNQVYVEHSPDVVRTQAFEKYFLSILDLYDKDEIEQKGSLAIDFKELLQDEGVRSAIPDMASVMKETPEKILSCLGLAVHQVLTHDLERQAAALQQPGEEDGETPAMIAVNVPLIHTRVFNYEPITSMRRLKANFYGKYVCIRGTVVRVSNVKPMCIKMAFECLTCKGVQRVILPEGKYCLPTKCPAPDCRGRSFVPLQNHQLTETVDWQTIKVQELITDENREAGRIPRTVECELTRDLVDSCAPGDVVTVTGIVKVMSSEEGRRKSNRDQCMFLIYISANSVSKTKGKKSTKESGTSGLAMEFTLKELYGIQEIQEDPHVFRLVVGSLCPAIYGHETVKAGLALALFGGNQRFANNKNRIPVRGDPHVLVVGDPGLGKSQMLQAVSNVAPRGVYVCGNTTTASGLTVTLSRDSASGDFALEAGALVLADQGCCCIDEFDKMTNQHQALLEAMEQQSISLAKAGIVCSLPARTSILAAANPVGGHYNKAKTVAENLKMGSALLSRFDLVFILLDNPDEDLDSMLSEHVMALRAGRGRETSAVRVRRDTQTPDNDEARRQWELEKPLSERLKISKGEQFDPIPHPLLRKYVAYARKYVHPKLSPEAKQVLQTFYLELRKDQRGPDSIPITTRQLESLIRLTEARSRLELRETATSQDAQDVVEIMKDSMFDTYSDEFGQLDFLRSQNGSGMSSRSKPKRFVAALNRVAERTYNNIFTVQQMREIAQNCDVKVPDFEGFIASLNNQGYLLKKGSRVYQLQTAGL
ncbi:DNA helicase MCM8-like [Branchiostoma lanceolatum]|uniref:DNA helicase MCM8-like n=1 Tax=Branchiostoma lanceolatum TaxID=7740 RepID=UPI003456007E